MATPTLAPADACTDLSDGTTHIFCCNRERSLCGQDLTEVPEVPDGVGHDCVVCLDLETQPCPRCGFHPDTEGVQA